MRSPVNRRSSVPSSSARVAGARPSHTVSASAGSQPMSAIRPASAPTASSTSTASGQPSISTTRQAPDHCNCKGMACSEGSAHSQGSSTRAASSGVHSADGVPWRSCTSGLRLVNMRQGCAARAAPSATKRRAASSHMVKRYYFDSCLRLLHKRFMPI